MSILKYEEKDSLVKLIKTSFSNWTEVWDPITEKYPEVTVKKIPDVLKPVEKIDLNQLEKKLTIIETENMAWKDNNLVDHIRVSNCCSSVNISTMGAGKE